MLNYDDDFIHFREKLAAGAPLFGLVLQNPVTAFAELIALSGFDFAWIDMEHTAMSFQDIERMIIALELHGCIPLVRVRENEPNQIGQVLDMGARIVNIPHVDTAGDARRAVYGAKYYPLGRRGYATVSRSTRHGMANLDIEMMREKNERTLLMVQIESEEAVRNAEEIAGVEGVDVVFIGYADLSQDMGINPDPLHPRCEEAAMRVGRALKRTGKPGAFFVSDPGRVPFYRDMGFTMISCGIDTLLLKNAAEKLIALYRKAGEP
jgi:2-keto-3-deoxy-L-rhamnonate aldolase RhmA